MKNLTFFIVVSVVSIGMTLQAKPKWEEIDCSHPVTLQAGADWIPLQVANGIEKGSALDFSELVPRETAGKYGYVVVRDGHFEFEKRKGVPCRFYGVNLCGTASVHSPSNADAVATFLARTGYNTVRIHHHENSLRNWKRSSVDLDPVAMRKFDAMMAACIRNGLYLSTDLFVSRQIPYREVGIDKDGMMQMQEVKTRVLVNKKLRENVKAFNRNLLGHVNPHTGRRYADEPALSWISLINEGNYWQFAGMWTIDKYPEWKEAWQTWLKRQKAKDPTFTERNEKGQTAEPILYRFFAETYRAFFAEMKHFLREEMGCRALLTDCNNANGTPRDQMVRTDLYDFVDDHFYIDHPEFLQKSWRLPSWCPNINPIVKYNTGEARDWWKNFYPFRRLYGKPFVISEYNFSGPGRFRGVGGIATATLGALQDWDGLWRFAWGHSAEDAMGPKGRRAGYFNMANDPLGLAAERASLCLFLRRDLSPLTQKYYFVLPRAKLQDLSIPRIDNGVTNRWITWHTQVGTVVANQLPADLKGGCYPEVYRKDRKTFQKELFGAEVSPAREADAGAVYVDSQTGTFLIKSARTCGGFTERGVAPAGALTVDVGDTAATVWVSSLSGEPISQAKRLLLTHLTDLQNTGITYADKRLQTLLAWGSTPHLLRRGTANILLTLDHPERAVVYALDTMGRRRCRIPTRIRDGRLSFVADTARDPQDATLLYEILNP